ncbi:MAG: DNA polymerase III subunit chi [Caldimonas sp.]
MTEITFHFNVPDRSAYACRLLRKATRQGARIAVTGTPESLVRLDRDLWEFDPVEFIPHVLLRSGQALAARLQSTPVLLVERPDDTDRHEVLVNLGEQAPVGFESYSRLIEIVSTADDDRSAARFRWKHYAARGYSIKRHEVAD